MHNTEITQLETGEYVLTCSSCDYRASAWYSVTALVAAQLHNEEG